MIVGLLLLQGALLKASVAEFYQAIAPSLQNAKSVLKNPMISADVDSVLNGLLGAVQNGTISKQAALNTINGIKNAVEAYKNKQYSSFWSSWFSSTPQIVKDTVQPALDKVNNAIAALNGNEWTPLAIAGVTVGAVAGATAAVGGGYAVYKWNKNRKKKANAIIANSESNLAFNPFDSDDSITPNEKFHKIAVEADIYAFDDVFRSYSIEPNSPRWNYLCTQKELAIKAAEDALAVAYANDAYANNVHDNTAFKRIALDAAKAVYEKYAQAKFIETPAAPVKPTSSALHSGVASQQFIVQDDSNPFIAEQAAVQAPSSTSSSISDFYDQREWEKQDIEAAQASVGEFSSSLDSDRDQDEFGPFVVADPAVAPSADVSIDLSQAEDQFQFDSNASFDSATIDALIEARLPDQVEDGPLYLSRVRAIYDNALIQKQLHIKGGSRAVNAQYFESQKKAQEDWQRAFDLLKLLEAKPQPDKKKILDFAFVNQENGTLVLNVFINDFSILSRSDQNSIVQRYI